VPDWDGGAAQSHVMGRREASLTYAVRVSNESSVYIRRSDIHEEASVKTGARRLRDFPDIHSASSAMTERQERVFGRPHSTPRRRDAPRRTSGCDLGPATDLDLDSLLPVVPVHLDRSPVANHYHNWIITKFRYNQIIGRNRERLARGAGGSDERPCSPVRCRRNPDRMSLRRPSRPRPASVDHLLPRAPRPVGDTGRSSRLTANCYCH
jgi:hypothetical protein